MKRILTIMISLILTAALFTCAAVAAEGGTATIAEQIRGFAASINQADADDSAAAALASHALTGRGKKLSVGKPHALTAALMNSEMIQQSLTAVCEQSVELIQSLGEKTLYLDLHSGWATFGYYYEIYRTPTKNAEEMIFKGSPVKGLTGNAYDQSLVWMAGSMAADMEITESAVTAEGITYDVSVRFWDRFDFSTSSGDGFKDLISGLGALLFREFDWESNVSFQILVPNTCTHAPSGYHWVLNPETGMMESDGSAGYTENKAEKFEHQISNGSKRSYFGLDQTVILSHDKPWEMEMIVTDPQNILFNATAKSYDTYPSLMLHSRNFFCARQYEQLDVSETFILANTHCYGTALRPNFSFIQGNPYKLCIENRVFNDGTNMIYLTVYNYAGGVSLPTVALDSYYFTDTLGTVHQLLETGSNGVSGMDFRINYFGSGANDYYGYSHEFSAKFFDLRIWEDGRDGGGDYFTSEVTASTCSARGYTTHTCALCGYSYIDDYTKKTEHKLTDWRQTAAPTCEETGTESRGCADCGYTETREIPAVGHAYEAWAETAAPSCTETGSERRACANCDHFQVRDIPAQGHAYNSVVTLPTCTEGGCTVRSCENCSASETDSHTEPLGHQYTGGICQQCGDRKIAPTVKATNRASDGKPGLRWEKVDGAVKYMVYRAASGSDAFRLMKTVSGTTYTNTTAAAGRAYDYYVIAVDANGIQSEPSSIVRGACKLANPEIRVGNRASDGAVTIQWEKVEGATKYEVYRATSKNGSYTRLTTTKNTGVNNTSTTAGKTYYYKVRAICDEEDAKSDFSAIKSRTRDLARPEVEITRKSGKPYVKWDKVSNATGYKIYRSTSKNGTYQQVATTSNRYYKDQKASRGRTYYYKVVAVCKNTAGNSAYSGVVSIKSR